MDLTLEGVPLRAGQPVHLIALAANRDPRAFDEPDRFVPDAARARHLSFGLGAHHCLGAALARAEAQEAFAAIARAWGSMEPVGDPPRFVPFSTIRQLDAVRLRATPLC